MHAPPHLLADRLELRSHAVAPGLPFDQEATPARFTADEDEAEEVEGFRLAERIMRAAPGSESVREPEEVFLVDRVEHRSCRPLDDLVFQGRNRERALTPVRLGYVHAP